MSAIEILKMLLEQAETDVPEGHQIVAISVPVDVVREIISMSEKTGKWIRKTKHHVDSEQDYYYYEEQCPECGAKRKIGWAEAVYCPQCGAKMEGIEDGD